MADAEKTARYTELSRKYGPGPIALLERLDVSTGRESTLRAIVHATIRALEPAGYGDSPDGVAEFVEQLVTRVATFRRLLDSADEYEGRLIDACRALHRHWKDQDLKFAEEYRRQFIEAAKERDAMRAELNAERDRSEAWRDRSAAAVAEVARTQAKCAALKKARKTLDGKEGTK